MRIIADARIKIFIPYDENLTVKQVEENIKEYINEGKFIVKDVKLRVDDK